MKGDFALLSPSLGFFLLKMCHTSSQAHLKTHSCGWTLLTVGSEACA